MCVGHQLSIGHAKISVNILRSISKWTNEEKDEREIRATWGLFDLLIEWMRSKKQKPKEKRWKTFNKSLYWAYRHDWSCFDWQACSVFSVYCAWYSLVHVCESNVRQFMRIAHVICPSRINLLTFTIAAVLLSFSFPLSHFQFDFFSELLNVFFLLFSNVIITWHIHFIGNQIFL